MLGTLQIFFVLVVVLFFERFLPVLRLVILDVVLFFAPELLRADRGLMDSLAERVLRRAFVLPYFLGQLAALTFDWAPFPAARTALAEAHALWGPWHGYDESLSLENGGTIIKGYYYSSTKLTSY